MLFDLIQFQINNVNSFFFPSLMKSLYLLIVLAIKGPSIKEQLYNQYCISKNP